MVEEPKRKRRRRLKKSKSSLVPEASNKPSSENLMENSAPGPETRAFVENEKSNDQPQKQGSQEPNKQTEKSQGLKKQPRTTPKKVTFFSDDEDDINLNRDTSPRALKQRAEELLVVRKTLPVYTNKERIVSHLASHRVTVLIGETGSGKSTQIPQFLIEKGEKVAVTQPRRVAAINLATRVAEEYGTRLGDKVGYLVRFDTKAHPKTQLKYLTDGMLLRELMADPLLKNYTTVVIDEAHERTILSDMLMGFLKELLKKREDLFHVLIMSATLDADRFAEFFSPCETLYVEGKMYPVERFYLEQKSEDILDTTICTVAQVNHAEATGDVLVFLPGQEEIEKACNALREIAPLLPREVPEMVPLPLYAALPPAEQLRVFHPVKKRQRKIILATNIAETSVTVPGVRYVIDSGLRKVKIWRHALGLSTLLTVPVSRASATQRSGRAGREAPGKVFRLYTEDDFDKLPAQTEPEIVRTDIAHAVLMLKRLQVEDVVGWSWLEHPGNTALFAALKSLYALKALDDSGRITPLGVQMSVLPVLPQLASVLVTAHEAGCLQPVIDIVACLNVENLVLNPPSDKRDEVNEKRRQVCVLGCNHGDLIMFKELLDYFTEIGNTSDKKHWCRELFLNYRGFKNVFQIRAQITLYMRNLFGDEKEEEDSDDEDGRNAPLDVEKVIKCFIKGYVANTAIGYPDRSYRTIFQGELISVHPSSLLFGKKCDGIMYIEFVYTTKGYARTVSSIDPEWVLEIAPHVVGRESVNKE